MNIKENYAHERTIESILLGFVENWQKTASIFLVFLFGINGIPSILSKLANPGSSAHDDGGVEALGVDPSILLEDSLLSLLFDTLLGERMDS